MRTEARIKERIKHLINLETDYRDCGDKESQISCRLSYRELEWVLECEQ